LTRLERAIGIVLRAGVMASSVLLATGLVLSLAGAGGSSSYVLLQTGILILLFTPMARVVISTVEYATSGEWRFAALTAIVLLELIASGVAALVFNKKL
jgi:uncharacterized membrane protein